MNILQEVKNAVTSGKSLRIYRISDLDGVKDEISLDEFEECANRRLQCYLDMDKRGTNNKTNSIITSLTYLNDPKNYMCDVLSHFIMRAAFSTSEKNQQQFIEREVRIFEYRSKDMDIDSIIKATGYEMAMVDEAELAELNPKYIEFEKNVKYKVEFESVQRLMSARRVVLHNGFAYISEEGARSYIIGRFENDLKEGIEEYAAHHQKIMDERITESMKELSNLYVEDVTTDLKKIEASSIAMLAPKSFPPCMYRMYLRLCNRNKLFYEGREQFGRFLKAIGLSMESCLEFFQSHFTRAISIDKFNKEYSYNIRYMYGKEGHRIPLGPRSCEYLIKSQPSGEQCHGCPFACLQPSDLENFLLSIHMTRNEVADIVQYAKAHNYDKACRAYYRITHSGNEVDLVSLHPVMWFMKSKEYYEKDNQQLA